MTSTVMHVSVETTETKSLGYQESSLNHWNTADMSLIGFVEINGSSPSECKWNMTGRDVWITECLSRLHERNEKRMQRKHQPLMERDLVAGRQKIRFLEVEYYQASILGNFRKKGK